MKLYYYPSILSVALVTRVGPLSLYTEAEKEKLTEAEQRNLVEVDEEAIAKIGNIPCEFRKVAPLAQRLQEIDNLRVRLSEYHL